VRKEFLKYMEKRTTSECNKRIKSPDTVFYFRLLEKVLCSISDYSYPFLYT